MFLLSGIFYVIAAQTSGWLIRYYEERVYPLILLGFLCAAITCILSGPMFPLPLHTSVPLDIVRQILFGIASGPVMVGTFSAGKREMAESGITITPSSSAAFSAIYQSAFSGGYVAAAGKVDDVSHFLF